MDERPNANSGLCTLPAEILGQILRLSQRPNLEPDAEVGDHHAWAKLDYSWLSLAVTCSHVWSIAVQERDLWSWIEYRHVEVDRDSWTAHTISRAGHVPLRMRAVQYEEVDTSDSEEEDKSEQENTSEQVDKFNEWAVHYLPRAQVALIVLDGSTYRDVLPLLEALRQPKPLLRTLGYSNRREIGIQPLLDHRFLGGSSHTLRRLVLVRVAMGDTMPALPALRELHLSAPWFRHGQYHPWSSLQALLAQAPALETIRLEHIRVSSRGAQARVVGPIPLPSLASITITDTQAVVTAAILADLPMPARELVVQCPNDQGSWDSTSLNAAHVNIFARCSEFWATHSPSVPMLPGGTLTITGRNVPVLEYVSETATPRLSCRIASSSLPNAMLEDIQNLRLESVRMPWAMMPDHTTLPGLRTMVFQYVDDDPRLAQMLETWVWARVREPATDVQTISFVRCPIAFERISEQLKARVPHVTFSGKEQKTHTGQTARYR